MIQGLYSAATGMVAIERRHDVLANNVANAATPGYKRQEPVNMGFYQLFSDKLRHPAYYRQDVAPGGGVKMMETFPNLSAGQFYHTDDPLHVALQGPGFLVADTPNGPRYTRSGDLSIDGDGDLATRSGFKIQGVGGGAIPVGDGRVNIGLDGGVLVNGQPAGQLRLVEFENPERLLREGDSLYRASEEVAGQLATAGETFIQHKRLEMSNVNLPMEMGRMVIGMRAYEANQRVITTIDSTLGRLIDQVAVPR
jgi:flagellar basal-body rod protein FlgG